MNATMENMAVEDARPSRPQASAAVARHEVLELAPQSNAVQAAGPRTDSQVFFQIITSVASNAQVDMDKMERMLAMHERMAARDNEQAFNTAMMGAQGDMGRISADATNSQTRSKYATYGQLDRHVRPVYTSHGFSLSFDTTDGAPDGCLRVLAYVSHKAGHTRTYRADVPADGKGAKGGDVMTKTHATGSAMSYGMRYLLKMIFNVAVGEDDDDGNAAGAKVEIISNKVLGGLLADLKSATSDEAVCQIWATGSKALDQTGASDLVDELGEAVAARRADFTYPPEAFAKNLTSWVEAVTSGRKSEPDLLAFIQSKHPLSVDQKDRISKAILAAKQ